MTGQVHAFACNRPHPQLGDKVLCARQRFHAGDHRSERDGTLREWADQAAPAAAPIVDVSDGADVPDDWTELEVTGPARDPLWVAALLVLVAVLIAAPAVLVILYGQAF